MLIYHIKMQKMQIDQLTTREFERHPTAVLNALMQGRTVWLTDGEQVIAHLTPTPHQPLPTPATSPTVMRELARSEAVLGAQALSRVLNLTLPVFTSGRDAGAYAPTVLRRLSALAEALAEQEAMWPLVRQKKWWQRRHAELKGCTPIEHLGMPWLPGSDRWEVLRELIRRERLLRGSHDES